MGHGGNHYVVIRYVSQGRVRVTVKWGYRILVTWRLFNNNSSSTSAALAEVCALLNVIIVFYITLWFHVKINI